LRDRRVIGADRDFRCDLFINDGGEEAVEQFGLFVEDGGVMAADDEGVFEGGFKGCNGWVGVLCRRCLFALTVLLHSFLSVWGGMQYAACRLRLVRLKTQTTSVYNRILFLFCQYCLYSTYTCVILIS